MAEQFPDKFITMRDVPSVTDGISDADIAVDYSEIITDQVFLGNIPYASIIEGLTEQFNDYIKLEDDTDYVDAFYTQLHLSYNSIEQDDEEFHGTELREALDKIHQSFIDFMATKFQERLTITIRALDAEEYNRDDIERIFRHLYSFFILGAKANFTTVITADTLRYLGEKNLDDDTFFKKVNHHMGYYTPLFKTMGPMEFLKYANATEIIALYETGQIGGNFLRKYSPKFYQNTEFLVDVINQITIAQNFRNDLTKIADI
jgi:hypothetical protein